ncbi:hypothetical protein LXL04_012659 [Taraxacum kok-saghyz]
MGDDGWTEVKRRSRKSVFERLGNQKSFVSKYDQLEKVSLTVYVANYPSHLYSRELRSICGRVGTVVDVYIANKKNVQGQSYGFVRFIRVENVNALVQLMCKIRIGKLWLHANVSRRPRSVNQPIPQPRKNVVSFASVVSGRDKVPENVKPNQSPPPSISLDGDVMLKSAYPFALVVCFKDLRATDNIRSICQGEGFHDVEPKYIGGLWVLLDFLSLERREAFQQHHAFASWFSVIKPWKNDFVVPERILWVEVEGIPLLACSEDTFNKIASKWGEMVFVDNSDPTNRFSIRMGIKTGHAALVFESVYVNVLGVEYCLRTWELSYWSPTFVNGFKEDDGDGFFDGEEEDSESNESDLAAFHYVSSSGSNEMHEDSQLVVEPGTHSVEDKVPMKKPIIKEAQDDSDSFHLAELIDKELQKPKVMGVPSGEKEPSLSDFPPSFSPQVSLESLKDPGVAGDDEPGVAVPKNYDSNLPRTPISPSSFDGPVASYPDKGATKEGEGITVTSGDDSEIGSREGKPFLQHSVSILEKLDSAIAVGKALGWDMAGCEATLKKS